MCNLDREEKEAKIKACMEHISELSEVVIDILYGILC